MKKLLYSECIFLMRDDVFNLLCTHVIQGCRSRPTLRGTEPPRMIWLFVCVYVCMCWMRTQLLVAQKTPLRTPYTRTVSNSNRRTSEQALRVGGLVGRFEACVRIAADFPQQWPQGDLPRS